MGAQIEKIEFHFPEKKVTNQDLANEFPDYDFSKFETKVGIQNRYVVEGDTTALDLAVKACEKLFETTPKVEIDFILYCTQSPDYFLPTTSCILQDRVGLRKNIGALDFNLGCSGFTYGLSMAKALIESGQAKKVLLVTAETYSKFLNPEDRSNRAIFGDAAAATLVSYSNQSRIGNFLFGTDGAGYDKLIVRNGACKHPFDSRAETIEYGSGNRYTSNDLYMNGPDIFDFTNAVIPGFTQEVMEANDLSNGDVDQFVFHQANAFMLNFMRKRMKVDKERFYINLADGGNTVSCTIPIALKRYSQTIESNVNQKIVLAGFGVGLSWSGGAISLDHKL